MLFSKRGLPLIDMKMPAASLPIAATHFHASVTVPLSLFEDVKEATLPIGTTVKKGEVLYTDGTAMPTVSPVSGELINMVEFAHPVYGALQCVSLRPEDGEETLLPLAVDPETVTTEQVIQLAKAAGIIDETDGTPLFEKLESYQNSGCHLVADGTEPQPYASAAYSVLCEKKKEVKKGLALAARVVAAAATNITVCVDNAAMRKRLCATYSQKELFFAPKRYPVEKYTAAQTEALCKIGVQALYALYEAVYEQKAATSAVITVAGDVVKQPQNLRVPYGTPIQSLLDFCGIAGTPAAMLAGDAYTGIALTDTAVPVLPGMTCLLLLSAVPGVQNDPCIGCGRCAQVCHKELLPFEIVRRLENMHYERLAHLRADACDGCGACSFVCPAKRDVKNAVLYAAQSDGSVFLDWGGNDDA